MGESIKILWIQFIRKEGKKEVKLYKILCVKLKEEKGCHNLNFLEINISPSCSPLQIPYVLRGLRPRSSENVSGCVAPYFKKIESYANRKQLY